MRFLVVTGHTEALISTGKISLSCAPYLESTQKLYLIDNAMERD